MPDETIDLSGEQDPEERMATIDEQSQPDTDETARTTTHDGSVTTEEFDTSEALERL